MRPRVFPAEDRGGEHGTPTPAQASMRPRVFPAEDILDLCKTEGMLLLQ